MGGRTGQMRLPASPQYLSEAAVNTPFINLRDLLGVLSKVLFFSVAGGVLCQCTRNMSQQ